MVNSILLYSNNPYLELDSSSGDNILLVYDQRNLD